MTGATRSARVRVPASCANVGAGYDCVGFALDRWLTATVTVRDPDRGADNAALSCVRVHRAGSLASLTLPPTEDVVVQGFAAACEAAGRPLPARLDFALDSEIPVARGLGSSSAALVAGALLANRALELGLDRQAIADMCTTLEGHPDNVAPAVFGGAVLGVPIAGAGAPRWAFATLEVHATLAFAFVVPAVHVDTAAARAVLPTEVAHDRAVAAVAKGAALVQGLTTGDVALLRTALDDLLHVPYRRHLVPGYADVVAAATAAGAHGATLSGSGSTMVALGPAAHVERIASAMRRALVEHGVVADSFVQREAVRT
ncbi:MAG: homoserine kinase [Longimicrobiales bacterium]